MIMVNHHVNNMTDVIRLMGFYCSYGSLLIVMIAGIANCHEHQIRYGITTNVPLFKKMRDIMVFMLDYYF